MRKFSAIILGLALLALPVLATQSFLLTTPFNGPTFSAVYPTPDSEINAEVTNGATTDGASAYTGYTYSTLTKNGNAWFGLAVFDYDSNVNESTVAFLDSCVDGGISAMKGTLVPGSRTSGTLAGYFSREGESVDNADDSFLRVSVAGNRRFIGVVIFDKSLNATRADADEFFDSVRSK